MPREILRNYFNLTFYSLFLGTFFLNLQQAFWPQAPLHIVLLLFVIPFLTGLILIRKPAERPFSGLKLLLLVLLVFFPALIAYPVPSLLDPLPWQFTFGETLLITGGIFLGIPSISLLAILVSQRDSSLWKCLLTSILIWTLTFSYYDLPWSVLFPLHIITALVLQASLRWREKAWVWVSVLLTLSMTLGTLIPAFAPTYWVQHIFNKDKLLDQNESIPAGNYVNQNTLFFWNTFDLGQPIGAENAPMFYVQSPFPQYWRSEVFDSFMSWGWSNQQESQGNPVKSPIQFRSDQTDQTVVNSQVINLQPFSSNVGLIMPGLVHSVIFETRDNFEQFQDLDVLKTTNSLKSGSKYNILSENPTYMADDLRQISELPKTVSGYNPKDIVPSQRLTSLVEEITASKTNPYDKIMALTNYLKTTGTYTLTPRSSGSSSNGNSSEGFISDFLFNTHEGYCVHFSSALAVMAQSLGYPARWVVGFTQGEPLPDDTPNPFSDQPRDTVRVLTQANAHSWVEIYFPGYGWIPFEATPGFPGSQAIEDPLENPTAAPAIPVSPSTVEETVPDTPKEVKGLPLPLKIPLAAGAVLALLVALIWRYRPFWGRVFVSRLKPKSDREQIQALYLMWRRRLIRLGIAYKPEATIREHALQLEPLGTEWYKTWISFSQGAEQACYAPIFSKESLAEITSRAAHLETLYHNDPKSRLSLTGLWERIKNSWQ